MDNYLQQQYHSLAFRDGTGQEERGLKALTPGYVKVDERNGGIIPGDMLTTSEKPGCAMKVINWDDARGAIIGKALTQVDENGYVLVLVSLQWVQYPLR